MQQGRGGNDRSSCAPFLKQRPEKFIKNHIFRVADVSAATPRGGFARPPAGNAGFHSAFAETGWRVFGGNLNRTRPPLNRKLKAVGSRICSEGATVNESSFDAHLSSTLWFWESRAVVCVSPPFFLFFLKVPPFQPHADLRDVSQKYRR